MYLPEQDVSRLFRALWKSPLDRVRLIFSFMSRWPDGGSGFRPRSGWIERWLTWSEEPFMWAIERRPLLIFQPSINSN